MSYAPGRVRFVSSLGFAVLVCATALLTMRVARSNPPPTTHIWYCKHNLGGLQNGSSFANGFPNLDAALTAASAGDQIWIAQGTWEPQNPNTGFVITTQVQIYGAFLGNATETLATRGGVAAQTIITGLKTGYVPAPHVISMNNIAGPAVVIDSVLIRDGYATGYLNGGGINATGTDLTLNNCIVTSNYADLNGGGLYFGGTAPGGNTLRMLGCEFSTNSSGFGDGGSIFGSYIKGDTMNTIFRNSSAAGNGGALALWNMGYSNPMTVTDSIFWNNAAGGTASLGGAVYLGESQADAQHAANVIFVNCTMTDNSLGSCAAGQAIYFSAYSASQCAIYNSILAYNGGAGCTASSPVGEGAAATVQYCDCWNVSGSGAHAGTGNVSANPQFRDHTVVGGLTLKAASPCIDSGDYDRVTPDTFDLDGDGITTEKVPLDFLYQKRLVDRPEADSGHTGGGVPGLTYLDMGAYEKP